MRVDPEPVRVPEAVRADTQQLTVHCVNPLTWLNPITVQEGGILIPVPLQ